MARARMENLGKFREALRKADNESMIRALTHDFGTRENARIVLAYLATAAGIWRLEMRVKIGAAFAGGILAMLIVDVIVRFFA